MSCPECAGTKLDLLSALSELFRLQEENANLKAERDTWTTARTEMRKQRERDSAVREQLQEALKSALARLEDYERGLL